MSLINGRLLKKLLQAVEIPEPQLEILSAWRASIVDKTIFSQNETSLDAHFIQKILVEILGYRDFGDERSLWKNKPIGSGNVDIALGNFAAGEDKILAPFELKGAKTRDLDAIMSGRYKSPVQQAWEYAIDAPGAQWVLVSNYLEIRLYAVGYGRKAYEVWDLSKLTEPLEYARFQLLLNAKQLLSGATAEILRQSEQTEKEITKQFYADYKQLREHLLKHLAVDNPEVAPLDLIRLVQKLLDRVLFVAFAEDRGLLPSHILAQADAAQNLFLPPQLIWNNFKGLFHAIDSGSLRLKVSTYNGGLFQADEKLDNLVVSDELCHALKKLGEYDFESEISVAVLGHIFEQSITDIEELQAKVRGEFSEQVSKRKRDGVFYTPAYITFFIVEQTVGKWLAARKAALGFDELPALNEKDYESIQQKRNGVIEYNENITRHIAAWEAYKSVLSQIKVIDPACGSGAFLNEVFDFLYQEGQTVNERLTTLNGGQAHLFRWDTHILANNLHGVDINHESVEITKLSLWLKTANKQEKLTYLDDNIKCGNSLISDSSVAGDKAFSWNTAFAEIMKTGGFDVIVGNPPYVRQELFSSTKPYLQQNYQVYHGVVDLYAYFFELGLQRLKPAGMLGFISSASFFKTASGKPLRAFLQQRAHLQKIIDFSDLQIFAGVTTYPAILVFQNTPPTPESIIETLVLKTELPEKLSEVFAEQHGKMQQAQLNADGWQLEDMRLNQLRLKLTQGFPSLKSVYGSPLYGVKTGLNAAFVIDRAIKDKLLKQHPNSIDLLKPFLKGKNFKKWHAQPHDLWIILMPKGWTREKMGSNFSHENAWEWFQSHYTAVAQHLEIFAAAAEKRTDKGELWWELRACAYYQEFEKPKIQYGHFSHEPLFHLNSMAHYSNDKSYIIASSDEFLLGLLNSKAFWFLIIRLCPAVRGAYYELRAQYIETLPIPAATAEQKAHISDLAKRCQQVTEQRYLLEKRLWRRFADFGISKFTQKIERWWLLDFQAFQAELKKSYTVEINLKQRDEWENYFNEAREQHANFSHEIAQLEHALNAAVYTLFALNAEEIKLLEANA